VRLATAPLQTEDFVYYEGDISSHKEFLFQLPVCNVGKLSDNLVTNSS
jgi:hypothetical protein